MNQARFSLQWYKRDTIPFFSICRERTDEPKHFLSYTDEWRMNVVKLNLTDLRHCATGYHLPRIKL